MRYFITVYNSSTKQTVIAFRDDFEDSSEYFVDTDIPPFNSSDRAIEVRDALNAQQRNNM